MKPENKTTVFGADISTYTDQTISEAIQALCAEQLRRKRAKDLELVHEFKTVAQRLFDHHIMVHIDYQGEPIYLDSVENFFFEV